MTTLADVQNAIKAGIQFVNPTGSTRAVVWNDEAEPGAKALIILDLLDSEQLLDREDVDPTTGAWTMSTLYYLRVQVRAESIYNTPGRDALILLEAVRAGLQRPDLMWEAGVVYQADSNTYVHHVSYIDKDGHMRSSYSFETGFRAVVDFPTAPATVTGEPNMQEVVATGTPDNGEIPAPEIDLTVDRPT